MFLYNNIAQIWNSTSLTILTRTKGGLRGLSVYPLTPNEGGSAYPQRDATTCVAPLISEEA